MWLSADLVGVIQVLLSLHVRFVHISWYKISLENITSFCLLLTFMNLNTTNDGNKKKIVQFSSNTDFLKICRRCKITHEYIIKLPL